MDVTILEGDLLDQPTEGIVNAWNRNIIPWWLLVPQGVSGAIKKRGGLQPFREVGRFGPMPLGTAVHTSAGRLPFKAIIHVAGIDMLWRSSERSIRGSVSNAIALAEKLALKSLAFPVVGAGSGGMGEARALELMRDTFAQLTSPVAASIVKFRPAAKAQKLRGR